MNGFINDRNDIIDNAIFDALQTVASEEIDWDISIIGDVADFMEKILTENGIGVCRPWYSLTADESPCYKTKERCSDCKRERA